MLNNLFAGLFDTSTVTISTFLLCLMIALLTGLLLAFAYTYKNKERYTKGFVMTLAMIPAVVCVVIIMVNGNIGTGIAVAGAFGLVRFRSVPGTAKEISSIFIAMGTGLICGSGYLGYALLFTFIMSGIYLLYSWSKLGENRLDEQEKMLRITIPEDLDYDGVFDDLLETYTEEYQLLDVRTSNMGSLYKLKYHLILREQEKEKEFIDALRCRNGNLEIGISAIMTGVHEL